MKTNLWEKLDNWIKRAARPKETCSREELTKPVEQSAAEYLKDFQKRWPYATVLNYTVGSDGKIRKLSWINDPPTSATAPTESSENRPPQSG